MSIRSKMWGSLYFALLWNLALNVSGAAAAGRDSTNPSDTVIHPTGPTSHTLPPDTSTLGLPENSPSTTGVPPVEAPPQSPVNPPIVPGATPNGIPGGSPGGSGIPGTSPGPGGF